MTTTAAETTATASQAEDCPDWCRTNHGNDLSKAHVGGDYVRVNAGVEGSLSSFAILGTRGPLVTIGGQDYPRGIGNDLIRTAHVEATPFRGEDLANLIEMVAGMSYDDARALAASVRANAALVA